MQRFANVVLVDSSGRLLLQERDEFPRIDPECWGLCGGHVEDGEDHRAAAYRELTEETGLVLPDGHLALYDTIRVFHLATGGHDQVWVYAAGAALTDADIDCREGRRIVFVDPARALTLPLTVAAARVLPPFLRSATYARLAA